MPSVLILHKRSGQPYGYFDVAAQAVPLAPHIVAADVAIGFEDEDGTPNTAGRFCRSRDKNPNFKNSTAWVDTKSLVGPSERAVGLRMRSSSVQISRYQRFRAARVSKRCAGHRISPSPGLVSLRPIQSRLKSGRGQECLLHTGD
jgi:hypothetical protein